MYQVAVEGDDVLVRLSGSMTEPDTLEKFLDFLELEAVGKSSQLSQDQASRLAAKQ